MSLNTLANKPGKLHEAGGQYSYREKEAIQGLLPLQSPYISVEALNIYNLKKRYQSKTIKIKQEKIICFNLPKSWRRRSSCIVSLLHTKM